MFKHILISTDGSPLANKAAKAGIALANALRAKVTAYCAPQELQPIYFEGYVFDRNMINGFEDGARMESAGVTLVNGDLRGIARPT